VQHTHNQTAAAVGRRRPGTTHVSARRSAQLRQGVAWAGMGWGIDAGFERVAQRRVERYRQGDDRNRRQVVLDDLRERLALHVDVEIVVLLAIVVVTEGPVMMIRAVGDMHGRRRLLAVEAVVYVAMRVRDPCEEQGEPGEP